MFILIIISVMLACAPFIIIIQEQKGFVKKKSILNNIQIMSSGPCTFTEMLRA